MLWVRQWKWCGVSSFWSVSMTWWSGGPRNVMEVIMTSISVCQSELSGVAVEMWSLHWVWVILNPGVSPRTSWSCGVSSGAHQSNSHRCWILKAAFARQFFPAAFNCEASLIRQVVGVLGTVLLGVPLSLLVWVEGSRIKMLRGEKKKKKKGISPSWRAWVEDSEVTRAVCHCGGGEGGWSWLALVSLWKRDLANTAVIQCSLNACW